MDDVMAVMGIRNSNSTLQPLSRSNPSKHLRDTFTRVLLNLSRSTDKTMQDF